MQTNRLHAEDLRVRDDVLAGDRHAAESFVETHLDSLYEFVHYRVGADRATAEDVVQDTFLVALEKLPTFRGESTLHTWLCGIARNKIRAHRRRRGPLPLEDLLEQLDPEIYRILGDVEQSELPEHVLELKETQDLVGATLSSLPPDYRAALLRKYVEGLSVADMAELGNRSPKATESLLFRARTAFARVFELLVRGRGGLE